VCSRTDASKLDLTQPLVHRKDGDFPVAWAHMYGKGRVFYSTLGHPVESWDDPAQQQLYFNALRWSMGLVAGDATPIPVHQQGSVSPRLVYAPQ
jgi:type 1 glutamine amidotransferase